MTFTPHLEALPPEQRALWPELAAVPHRYVLYAGTALVLRFAHRPSVDFDFFAHDPLDHRELESALPFLRDAETLQEGPNTRTVLVRRGADVKVSFFGGLTFGRVGDPEPTDDGVLSSASLLDLGGTELKVLLQRVDAKDYRDIATLLDHGVRLEDMLAAARALYGPAFNPIVARKALCYFEGGDLAGLDAGIRQRLIAAATNDVDVTLPLRAPRLDRVGSQGLAPSG